MFNAKTNPVDVARYLERVTELQSRLQFFGTEAEIQEMLRKQLADARGHLMDILNGEQGRQINKIPQLTIPLESIKLEGRLGNGVFGTVYKGMVAGTAVALKVVKNPTTREFARIEKEAETMSKLSHPRLARFMGTTTVPLDRNVPNPETSIAIVSELCDTDLSKACQEKQKNNPHFQTQAVAWLCEAAEGIAWLHDMCHMLHRDIKPANILLKDGHAVVTDFGFTQVLDTADETLREKRVKGTGYHIAPEMLRNQPFSYPADVYAFAITMYEILSGCVPASKKYTNVNDFFKDVCRGVRPDVSRLTSQGINDSLIELIIECWDDDPQKRPKMIQVCDRLKEIFVETVVPKTSPAYDFWLKSFGNKLVDEVELSELLNCLPNKEDKVVEEAYKWILKGRVNPNTVTLCHLGNTCEWYGDWIHKGTALSLKTSLESEKWFLGLVTRQTAQQFGIDYVNKHHGPCFTVRCSETNPFQAPFTIDLFYPDHAVSCRILRSGDMLICPTLNRASHPTVPVSNIVELVKSLLANDLLHGVSPYDGTMSQLRSSSLY